MYSNLILLLAYFIYFCSVNKNYVQSEECLTPDNTLGQCIVIQDCPALYYILLERRQLTNETINYLRKAHCGFVGRLPMVCCEVITDNSSAEPQDLLPSRKVCGIPQKDKISGGELTTIGELPWMVLLEYQKPRGRGFHCGGSLISNRYVVTAAHCFLRVKKHWKLISVRLGEHDLNKTRDCIDDTPGFEDCSDNPLEITIEEQIPHELYKANDTNQHHDIALLRLSRGVEFTDFIRPICLPLSKKFLDIDYVGINPSVAGWGRTETRRQSDVLLKVEVPIVPKANCTQIYSKYGVALLNSQVCAGGVSEKDSCSGDSGGPLMAPDRTETEERIVLYGIVSFGPTQCGVGNFPGIYTRVADYIDWIYSHIRP